MRSKYQSRSFRPPLPTTTTPTTSFNVRLSGLLTSSLHGVFSLVHDSLGRVCNFVLELLSGLKGRTLLAALPQDDTGNLNDTNASEEEVNGGKARKVWS